MPTTSSLVPFLALAVAAAVECRFAAADPPPKPADLLAEYKNLGLPLPPHKARLVRYLSGGDYILNGVLQPKKFSLAFELQPGTKTEPPLLLQGSREWRAERDPAVVEMRPEAASADGIELQPDAALALAVQCHVRGWDALADALLARSQPKEGKATPTERLVARAWDYWVGRLSHPTSDRAPIAKRMNELMKRNPARDTEPNRRLVASLELALVPGKGKPGSVEALIDAVVDYHADTGTIGVFEPRDAYWRIAEKGFDAVPALIAALTDDRLTRSMMVGFNNFPSWNLRVGDIAGDLLEGLAGEELDRGADGESVGGGALRRQQGYRVTPEAAKAWWAKAEKVGEEQYVLDRILPPAAKEGQTLWPRPLPLRLIVVKYPKRLPELYRMALEKRPDVQSYALAEAVAKLPIPAKDKLDLFEAAGKHKDLVHRLPALEELKGLDAKRFDQLLLATVEGLPKDVTEAYWGCQEAAVARLAMASDDPRVWAALEQAIKRASFGLRMELLHHLVDRDEPRWRAERLRLLAAHLDDAEVRDEKADERFSGPGAGFPYDRITAGDAVAVGLGRMMGVEVPTKLDRTAAEWAEVREKVRKAVKTELDKPKSAQPD
jgi:hypothetical protein